MAGLPRSGNEADGRVSACVATHRSHGSAFRSGSEARQTETQQGMANRDYTDDTIVRTKRTKTDNDAPAEEMRKKGYVGRARIQSLPCEVLCMILTYLDIFEASRLHSALCDTRTGFGITWPNRLVATRHFIETTDGSKSNIIEGVLPFSNLMKMCARDAGRIARMCRSASVVRVDVAPYIDDQVMEVISSNIAAITTLELHECMNVTGDALRPVMERHGAHLSSLYLEGIRDVSTEHLCGALSRCARLAFALFRHIDAINADVIGAVPANNSIRAINIQHCKGFDDEAMRALAERCPRLSSLILQTRKGVTDKGAGLLSGMQRLEFLSMTGCAPLGEGMAKVLSTTMTITHLSLMDCGVSDDMIALAFNVTSRITRLKLDRNKDITARGVEVVAERCKELSHLSLYGCTAIDDGAIGHLCKVKRLGTLNVRGCHRITDAGMRMFLQGRTEPLSLCVAGCGGIGAGTVDALRQCEMLKSVCLSGVPGIRYNDKATIEASGKTIDCLYDVPWGINV